MQSSQFQVQKDKLQNHRLVTLTPPELKDGEILVSVERFAFTANNITYGVVGEKIGYWNFFPVTQDNAEQHWGVIPVWGIAKVINSFHPDIKEGERLYGYFPMGSHLMMKPGRIKKARFIDEAVHRASLPAVYNSYTRLSYEETYEPSLDNERILLFPLYATSYCLYDFLIANKWYGAGASSNGQIIIPSASSKTAIGLGMALSACVGEDVPKTIGVTSPENLSDVIALKLYDEVYTYADISSIPSQNPTVIVDMSGNGSILNQLHKHLQDKMLYCSNVGLTHYEDNQMGPDFIRQRSEMFFAPAHIQRRSKEWGAGIFEQKAMDFWQASAIKSRSWLSIVENNGDEAVQKIYIAALAGSVPSHEGHIIVF